MEKPKIENIEHCSEIRCPACQEALAKKILVRLLADLHTVPCTFPERESDEYDLGFQEGLRVTRHKIKEVLLSIKK